MQQRFDALSTRLAELGTLLAAGADYLITGDQDLLALEDRHPILTAAEFWRRHGG